MVDLMPRSSAAVACRRDEVPQLLSVLGRQLWNSGRSRTGGAPGQAVPHLLSATA